MLNELRQWFGIAGYALEAIGVITIVIGCIWATSWFVRNLRHLAGVTAYENLRRDLGRSIVLGLEFLIAGDIIRTVTVSSTFESVTVLAAIVLIRTFLTIMLTLEIEGRWPWQRSGTR
jgi:uncharacterized membrane protein